MLTCPQLSGLPGIRHGFFTRNGGVSTGIYESLNCGPGSGDNLEYVAENRNRVAAALGQPAGALHTAYQIHSAHAVIVDAPWEHKDTPEADALVTNIPGMLIGILTADCLPILLADGKNNVIAAVHAGWKGAVAGVIESALDAMRSLGAAPEHTVATIGPAIARESYEVGEEFRERLVNDDAENSHYFILSDRPGHYRFDLPAYGKNRLERAGIGQINLLARDTCLQEDMFFSYRRACLRAEPVYGRQVSAIVLEKS